MEILVENREAKVVKKWNDYCWQIKFKDNNEVIVFFYHKEQNYETL